MSTHESDRILLAALSQGDEEAFDAVFRNYYPKIKFFATRLCDDEAEGENIAQDLFMQLWIRRDRLTDIQHLENYIYTMAKRASFEQIRRSLRRQRVRLDTPAEASDDALDDELHCKELMARIRQEVERMPKQRRRIFLMSRYEGLTNEQIAQELGLSKRTVETHITLALQQLRQFMPLLELLTLVLAIGSRHQS